MRHWGQADPAVAELSFNLSYPIFCNKIMENLEDLANRDFLNN